MLALPWRKSAQTCPGLPPRASSCHGPGDYHAPDSARFSAAHLCLRVFRGKAVSSLARLQQGAGGSGRRASVPLLTARTPRRTEGAPAVRTSHTEATPPDTPFTPLPSRVRAAGWGLAGPPIAPAQGKRPRAKTRRTPKRTAGGEAPARREEDIRFGSGPTPARPDGRVARAGSRPALASLCCTLFTLPSRGRAALRAGEPPPAASTSGAPPAPPHPRLRGGPGVVCTLPKGPAGRYTHFRLPPRLARMRARAVHTEPGLCCPHM